MIRLAEQGLLLLAAGAFLALMAIWAVCLTLYTRRARKAPTEGWIEP